MMHFAIRSETAIAILIGGWSVVASLCHADERPVAAAISAESLRASDEQILQAFAAASEGYGSDEIVLDESLRNSFLASIDRDWKLRGNDWQTESLLRLISLRKAGKLPAVATKRGRPVDDALLPIAEIAARRVMDDHHVSTDRMLCDSLLRQQLLDEARRITPSVASYDVGKAILRLRKSRRLKPELVLRVVDWKRSIDVLPLDEVDRRLSSEAISTQPGVYLFRDKTGYLYIGEAVNLRARLQQHLSGSDRLSLREYLQSVAAGAVTVELHTFGDQSPARELMVRRAYESELIRSRNPRLNVRP